MKNLKELLVEKLSVDSIVLANNKFPIDGTLDDIAKFLEDAGFAAADESHNYNGTADDVFDYNKSKCFLKEKMRFWFADTSRKEVSKDNPIFFISMSGDLSTSRKIFNVYYCDSNNVDWVINIVKNDKKEFLKELNKRFGWR